MALLFSDGYDHYGTDPTLISRYWSNWSATSKTLIAGRINGKAIRNASTSLDCNYNLGANYATLVCGLAFRINSYPAVFATVASFDDGTTQQVGIWIDPTGKIQVKNGGLTNLFTSSNAMLLNTWYFIEFKATIHNTTGVFEVRVNGSSVGWVPQQTGQNTRSSSNNFATRFSIQRSGLGSSQADWDDVYVCDTSGSAPLNDFIGDCRINTKLAVANGATNQFTPVGEGSNYQCVDNNPPNDAVYVADDVVGHRDLYDIEDNENGLVPLAVTILHSGKKSDAGARSYSEVYRAADGTAYVASPKTLGTTFTWQAQIHPTDPHTGIAWTLANLNAAQFGQDVV